MALNLIGYWWNSGHLKHALDLPSVEVGNTNGLDQTLFHQLLHGLPRVDVINRRVQRLAILVGGEQIASLLIAHGPVDKVQIEVLQLQGAQCVLQCRLDKIRAMESVPQFAGDEQILTAKL